MGKACLLWVLSCYSVSSFALSSPKCSDLVIELQAMQRAQSEIKKSLVSDHEVFANTLLEYSDQVSGQSTKGARSPLLAAKNMKMSAQTIRNRVIEGQVLNKKLDEATQELIQKVSKCLLSRAG